MAYHNNTIRVCKHCGYMGKIPLGKDLPEGISGMYCPDCSTIEKRDAMDAENKKLQEKKVHTPP